MPKRSNADNALSGAIRTHREKLGLTLQDVAEQLGVARSTVLRYERGTVAGSDKLEALARVLRTTPEELLGWNIAPVVPAGGTDIPIYGYVAAGKAIFTGDGDNYMGTVAVEPGLAQGYTLYALVVRGDSMLPRMRDGDIIIARQCDDVANGQIAVVLVSGEATVKKIMKSAAGITLVPLNEEYEAAFFSNQNRDEQDVRIIGRVIQIRSEV